jgi:hypothetical protein
VTVNASPTEITTGATDAVLVIECIVILVCLRRSPRGDQWRIGLWSWVFGLLAFVSFLGSGLHGLEVPHALRKAFWKPLYLSLGMIVSLFLVGAIRDWRGPKCAKMLLPWSIGLGCLFFGLTEIATGGFVVFVIYEGVAMVAALAIYSFLAATRRLGGAGVMALAIFLNLGAAAVQASSISLTMVVPFDHNGLFHLVQMVAIATMGMGLMRIVENVASLGPPN